MRDLRSISSIFRRTSKGEYDAAAARDRDILSYPIKITNNAIAHEDSIRNAKDFTFTRWKLINWLRHNHKPYVKRYEQRPLGSENEEKISLEKTIRRSLERLVELELFQVVGQERISTGTSTTPIYKYTVFGYLIALIIQLQIIDDAIVQDHHESTERKSSIVDEIYNVFLQILMKGNKHAQSTYILYSKFFEICKQRGLFGDIVSLLKQIVGSDIDIITRQDLMNKLMELDFKDSENSKLFFRLLLWKEIVNALDPRTRNVFLHNVKLDCERGLMGELKNIRGYEKLRFDALQTPETKVVFECRCSSCPNYTPAALNVLDYKERMIYADIKPSKLSDKTYFDYLLGISELCLGTHPLVLKVKCPACQTDNSLLIPFLS